MPVVVPSRASIETVKAVRRTSVLRATIIGRSSSSSLSPTTGRQMMPLVCRSMKPTCSGVAVSAAMNQVALVLAIFVVDHDHHLAVCRRPR